MAEYLHTADYAILIAYLLGTMALGYWSTRSSNSTTASGYFLADRKMSWITIGLSMFMANIGSSTFLGAAGAASANGLGVLCYEYAAFYSYLLLAFAFMPIYRSARVYTLAEYIHRRFNSHRLRHTITAQTLIMYVLAGLSVEVYAGVLYADLLLGWDKYVSVTVLLAITALFTVVGGLTSVLIIDAVQTVVVIACAVILAVLAMVQVGGYDEMQRRYAQSFTTNYSSETGCGAPDTQGFHILRDIRDSNYPWLGSFVGANLLSAWNFCTTQLYVQQTLSARNLAHAQGGCIFGGFIKILPLVIMIWPGIVSRILYTDTVGCSNPTDCVQACGIAEGCANVAYIELMKRLLPVGLRGLMMAAMFAALVGRLTAVLNSGGTIFAVDVWCVLRKRATQAEKMVVSRLFICVLALVAILWMPIISAAGGGQIVVYGQTVTAHVTPPVLACFVVAMFFPRATEEATFWGLLVGMLLGCVRLCLIFLYPPPQCGEDETRPSVISDVHFLHFTIILFVFTVSCMVGLSLITRDKSGRDRNLDGLTWFTRDVMRTDKNGVLKPATDGSCEADPEPKLQMEIINVEIHTIDGSYCRIRQFVMRWLCGVEELEKPKHATAVQRNYIPEADTEEEEAPWARTALTISAVCLLAFGSFLWGFFA